MKTSRVLGQLAIASLTAAVFCVNVAPVQASTIPYQAATAPATKCVTATTKGMKNTADAVAKKEMAPFAEKAAYAKAVEAYSQGLSTAWAAMEEPYCGFGSYGAKSAIKSYSKNIARARDNFLNEVKRIKASGEKIDTSVTTNVIEPVKIEPVKTEEQKPEKVVVTSKSAKIPTGLTQGMRSASITELQRRLAKALKQSADDNSITGYFGPATKTRLIQYQLQKKIITSKTSPGAGQVGPRTAATLNAE